MASFFSNLSGGGAEHEAAERNELSLADLRGRALDVLSAPRRHVWPVVEGTVYNLATLPQRAIEASNRMMLTGEYDPAPVMEAALMATTGGLPFAARGAVGSAGGKLTRRPMDSRSRFARAAELGYEKTPFYRGERTGDIPKEFADGGFFSRDRDYSAGLARQGGRRAPEEYRLNLQNAFRDHAPVTADAYARIVAAARSSDPRFAADLVDQIAPGRSIDWLMEFARRNPQMTVAGSGRLLRQAIKMNAGNSSALFRRAGFDALDFGRDVQKLTGTGIRSRNAMFDPARAKDYDIMASLSPIAIGLGGAGAFAASYPRPD